MEIKVVGAGVAGLSAAIALREAGYNADVISAEPPAATTSAVAAAIWWPYLAEPFERVLDWGTVSLDEFARLASTPGSGVEIGRTIEYTDHLERPVWADLVPDFRPLTEEELPGDVAAGFEVTAPRIDPSRYLPYLVERLEGAGGSVDIGARLEALEEAPGDVVVNCTGVAARHLCGDDEVFPIRGQVVMVPNPGIEVGIIDERNPEEIAYVLPRPEAVVLGGTRVAGDWSLDPDPGTSDRILRDATRLEPRLAGLSIQDVRVGLRPGRTTVRVEAERLKDGRTVVHNYGYGGSGYTLSWGCAGEVVRLAGSAMA